MRLRPMRFDLYLGRTVFTTVLLTWAVLVGLDVVMAFSGEFKDIGKNGYTLGHAAAWVLYTVPRRAYTMFPTAAVIGALMGLGQLAATSELTALRALGLSRRRLSVSVAIALSLLTAVMVFSAETLGPWGQDRADALKASAKWGRDIATTRYAGLWAREGDTFLSAAGGEEQLVGDKGTRLILREVRLYRIAEDGRIASITHAATAEHDRDGWVLTSVSRDTFGERSATRQEVAREPWNSRLDAGALAAGIAKPRNLRITELRASIEYRERNAAAAWASASSWASCSHWASGCCSCSSAAWPAR